MGQLTEEQKAFLKQLREFGAHLREKTGETHFRIDWVFDRFEDSLKHLYDVKVESPPVFDADGSIR